ncbi:hypothetical protein AA0117_g6252 [Alternaria alternata]|uniref:Uncharacterized protein n=1 Tax=Alternaria alternata TaxID=5599 RepID=A0A4V1WRR5_ALTAL|nr:hypothetical protein AA0117_g6252 [Alternaria alternata]
MSQAMSIVFTSVKFICPNPNVIWKKPDLLKNRNFDGSSAKESSGKQAG